MDCPELSVLLSNPVHEQYLTAYHDGEPVVSRLDWHMDRHYTGRPNRRAMHRAMDARTGIQRVIHRTTVSGNTALGGFVGACPVRWGLGRVSEAATPLTDIDSERLFHHCL